METMDRGEGWILASYQGTGLRQIRRDESADAFASDADAVAHVKAQAQAGSERHMEALKEHLRDALVVDKLSGREPMANTAVRRVQVAVGFTKVLRSWLTAQEMELVVQDASESPYSGCASHDFCDANMAMAQAFKDVFGRPPEFEPETHEADVCTALWNSAWDLARKGGFDEDRIRRLLEKEVIEEATDAALDEGCKRIQDYLGVTSGDLAGMHFSGSGADGMREVLREYLEAERGFEP